MSQAYKGRGVVVGVVDSGIDLAHKDFQDSSGKTRVLYLWDQTDSAGPKPSGYNKGSECTKAQIDAGSCREKDTDGHGTHVTGTAAGNGNTRAGAPFRGVAPEADIIFVKNDEDGSDAGIVDGCNYIFQKAASMGKPAVCNLSLGGHADPHDGTSFLDAALDGLQGAGKIVVAANGNEGDTAIHLGYNVRGTNYDSSYSTYLVPVEETVGVYAVVTGNPRFGFYVYDSDDETVDGLTDLSLGTTGSKDLKSGSTSVGKIQYDATATLPDGSRVLTFEVIFTEDPTDEYTIEFYTYGTGHIDAWVSEDGSATWDTDSGNGIWPGDTKMTVGSPATGRRTLGVGAYVSKTSWVDSTGRTQNNTSFCDEDTTDTRLSDIACFSSLGPTRDGRTKPDITAPGMYIVSALSKDSTPDPATDLVQGGSYVVEQGTSMSTPNIVGLVALMLQAKPSLTDGEVKNILQLKARSDSNTGTVPNNTWGPGKADAFESVKAVAGTAAVVRTLTVGKSGSGTGTVSSNPGGISCGTTCSGSFDDGTGVTLTASADPGSSFAGWSGDCSGFGACGLTMSQPRSVTATFNGSSQSQNASFVLSTARVSGAGGAFYTTDLTVANTGSASTTMVLKFLGNNGDGRGGPERTYTIGPQALLTLSDVLSSAFGVTSGFGAIRITSPSDELRVIAQTSTPGFGGTFGQSVPAARPEDAISGTTTRSIIGVREDAVFRTNLILTNTTESPVDVNVTLMAENGSTLGSKRYSLSPLGMTQVSRVVRDIGIGTDIRSARLILSTPTGGGAFAAYASVIDSTTNDPRTLLPR